MALLSAFVILLLFSVPGNGILQHVPELSLLAADVLFYIFLCSTGSVYGTDIRLADYLDLEDPPAE